MTASLLAQAPLLAQVLVPEVQFNAATWVAFILANVIILAILAPKLLRDFRKQS